jgi:uncharacterized protein (TIGR02265 family)
VRAGAEVVEWNRPLRGDGVAAETRFARFPRSHTIKGMFFTRLLPILGRGEIDGLDLKDRPRNGRYLPFTSYPQVDYSRMAHLAATTRYPHASTREAMRQLARDDFAEFAKSRVARVALSFVGDCADTVGRMPDLYRMTLEGGQFDAEEIPGGVRVIYRDFYGWLDCYPLGTLEGVVNHYGHRPRIELHLQDDVNGHFDVTWDH